MKQLPLWIALSIVIVLGASWEFYPLSSGAARLAQLPIKGKNFSATVIPVNEFEEDFFANVNLIKRVYQVGDQTAFIYLLDGTSNRHAIHDPTYCFRGGGWMITDDKAFPLPRGEGKLYRAEKDGNFREALLWFSDGKHQYNSTIEYWVATTLRRLTLGYSGEEPILIVIQPTNENMTLDWNLLLSQFSQITQI